METISTFLQLGLTAEQTCILFKIEKHLTEMDIIATQDEDERLAKREWVTLYTNSCNDFLKTSNNVIDGTRSEDTQILVHWLSEAAKNSTSKMFLSLILLEATLFTPYFKLSKDDKIGKLRFNNETPSIKHSLETFANAMGLPKDIITKFRSAHTSAIRGITEFWIKILVGGLIGTILIVLTSGLAAPWIGSLFATAGLSGAAAISAGLAALGGGAIAVGGLGMAGGIMVVVGGGAILGATLGGGVGALLATSPDFALSQAAKLEVVMKEIVLTSQGDVHLAQKIIGEQRNAIRSLEDKLFEMQGQREQQQDAIKNLKKSIEILKKAVDRNQEFARENRYAA